MQILNLNKSVLKKKKRKEKTLMDCINKQKSAVRKVFPAEQGNHGESEWVREREEERAESAF